MKLFLRGLAIALSTGCKEEKTEEITVAMPDGAPAMAFASLMREGMDGVTFQVVTPTAIATKVTNKEEAANVDMCVLPITAASKLLGSGERYQMLSMVTSGNLYLLSKDEGCISALQEGGLKDLSYLVGKTVGVMQIAEMPGLAFKWSMQNYGLQWQELGNDGAAATDKVNLKAISGVDAMATNDLTAYLVAEPAASVQIKKGFTSVCSLEALYNKGEEDTAGYPQAVLMAKKSLVKNSAFVEDFLGKLQKSAENVSSLSGEQIVEAVSANLEDKDKASTLKANLLTGETVARCGVRFVRAGDCADAVLSYVQKICEVDNSKLKELDEDFFYQ